jgi:hypothetical protein
MTIAGNAVAVDNQMRRAEKMKYPAGVAKRRPKIERFDVAASGGVKIRSSLA